VQGGQSGFVCPPDPRAIAAKIEMLAKNPERAAAMGRTGQASVAQITWDHVARSLIAALRL
jgi:glycosyltransferase involved in cell wall biosynthesis